jgi:WD40 repeat protein
VRVTRLTLPARLATLTAVAACVVTFDAGVAGAQTHRRAPDLYVVAMSYEPLRTLQCTDARGAPLGRSEVSVSPDGSMVASATPREICLFDTFSGKRFKTLAMPSDMYTEGVEQVGNWALAFSPDGNMLAVFTDRFRDRGERSVLLWDLELEAVTQRLVMGTGLQDWVDEIAFSADASRIATTGPDRRVRVWNGRTGRVMRIWGDSLPLGALAMSPDGHYVAAGGASSIVHVWDVESGDEVAAFEGHEGAITALTYSPTGQFLASAATDGTIKMWEMQKLQYVRTMDGGAASLQFSPDGTMLAAAFGSLRLWDAQYGEIARTLLVDSDDPDAFRCIRVSWAADGRTLACSNSDGVVRLWRTELAIMPDETSRAAVVPR